MSEVVEKTLASLPGLLGLTGALEKGANTSRGFQAFVKNITNAKSKHEEDQVLQREITLLKQKLPQPNLSMAQKRDCLVRLIYCHMLGKDVSFGCIYAVKLAQQGSVFDKRVGYLACGLLMDDSHELVMLLVNTMQKDLMSTNILDNLTSLTAIPCLCSSEMIPAMLPLVKDKLSHSRDPVRKKAVLCMHYFMQKAPEMLQNDVGTLKKVLSDRDPSVVWATLHIFQDLIKADSTAYRDLVPGLLSLLGQVIGRKLPTDYDFHTVPAPWMTILLLRMLGMLGAHDQNASQEIYPVLKEVLHKTEPSHKMGLAVIFECLQTVTHIHPYPELVDHAVSTVGRFLSAKNINLKYLGLKALVSMASISPRYTVEHQEVVLDCLEHSDTTIQRQTLELLYKMAGPGNVEVINKKLLEFIRRTTDKFLRTDIVSKIIELTERFSTNLLWYIETLNLVIRTAEESIPKNLAEDMLWTISQACPSTGDESDPLTDKQLRGAVFHVYWGLLHTAGISPIVVNVAAWVLGEFSHCVQDVPPKHVITMLVHWYGLTSNVVTLRQIVSSLQKMAYYVTDVSSVVRRLYASEDGNLDTLYSLNRMDRELKQRIQEFERLCNAKQVLKIASNPETRPSLTQMDFSLSFLDDFVAEAIEQGAAPYQPLCLRCPQNSKVTSNSMTVSSLSFGPYPQQLAPSRGSSSSRGLDLSFTTSVSSGDAVDKNDREPGLNLKNPKKVWGKDGLITEEVLTKSTSAITDTVQSEPNNPSESPTLNTAQSTPPPPTSEQRKRTELASALFGSLRVDTSHDYTSSQSTELVNLSPVSSLDTKPTEKETSTADMYSCAPPVHCEYLTQNQNNDLSPKVPESDIPTGHFSSPVVDRPDTLSPDGVETPEKALLLGQTSLFSPEEQVLPGSIYSSFQMTDPEYKDFINVVSDKDYVSPEKRIIHREKISEDGGLRKNVIERDSLELEQTMYEEMHISQQSNASDDFVDPLQPLGSEGAADASPERSNQGVPKASSRDSHPSPWKMLGPRRLNGGFEDSTEESISIEVDSIEDSPPTDFPVDSMPHDIPATDRQQNCHLRITDADQTDCLSELEALPKSEVTEIFRNEDAVLRCQKVFKMDCLVLVLHFTLENDIGKSSIDFGRLSVQSSNCYDIALCPVIEGKPDPLPLAGSHTSIPVPGTTLVQIKPQQSPEMQSMCFHVSMPGTETEKMFEIEIEPSDFLRPSDLDVDQLGALWSSENLVQGSESLALTGATDLQPYMQILQDIGFNTVQTIGNEAVLASHLVNNTEQPIMLHCILREDGLFVTVKQTHSCLVSIALEALRIHFTHNV